VSTAGTWSLRGRLTWLLIAIAILAWAASSAWLYRSAVAEADRLFDAALVETAHGVLAVADREIRGREHASRRREGGAHGDDDEHGDDRDIELARIDHAHDEHVVYQVRRRDSAIVYRSPGAPTEPLAEAAATGFADVDAAGQTYRVFSLQAGHDGATIHVGQPMADRARLSRASALRLVLPGAVLILALVVRVIYLAVHRRSIPRRTIACLLAIAAEYTIVGFVRTQLEGDASLYTRYAYLSGILALIAAASLIGRPTIPVARRPLALAVGVVILAFSLIWNVTLLFAGRQLYAERADLTRALVVLGTTDPLPSGVAPDLSLLLIPSPAELRRVIATYGSPMGDSIAPGSVPPVSEGAKAEATARAQDPPEWLLALPRNRQP